MTEDKLKTLLGLEEDIKEYLLTHSICETAAHFKTKKNALLEFLNYLNYDIEKQKLNVSTYKRAQRSLKLAQEYLNKIDVEKLKEYYSTHSVGATAVKFNMKDTTLKSILTILKLPEHTGEETKQFSIVNREQAVFEKYGVTNVSNPTRHWFNIKTKTHITENLLRQRGFDQLFGTDYGKGTSNEELMLMYNFLEVYDCGQATYI